MVVVVGQVPDVSLSAPDMPSGDVDVSLSAPDMPSGDADASVSAPDMPSVDVKAPKKSLFGKLLHLKSGKANVDVSGRLLSRCNRDVCWGGGGGFAVGFFHA